MPGTGRRGRSAVGPKRPGVDTEPRGGIWSGRRDTAASFRGKEVRPSNDADQCTHPLVNRDEEGQGLAEYALILALIAIVAIIALIFLGGQVSDDPVDRRQLRLGRSDRHPTRRLPHGQPALRFRDRGSWTAHRGGPSAGCIRQPVRLPLGISNRGRRSRYLARRPTSHPVRASLRKGGDRSHADAAHDPCPVALSSTTTTARDSPNTHSSSRSSPSSPSWPCSSWGPRSATSSASSATRSSDPHHSAATRRAMPAGCPSSWRYAAPCRFPRVGVSMPTPSRTTALQRTLRGAASLPISCQRS